MVLYIKQIIFIIFLCVASCFVVKANSIPVFTNEKHDDLLLTNQEYAIADSMLNLTWQAIMKKLPKKEYDILKKEQVEWLESGRSEMASHFAVEFTEDEAFMVSVVARTQQLSQKIWQNPQLGNYLFQDKLISITEEDGKIYIQGYASINNMLLNQDSSKSTSNKNNKKQKNNTDGKQLLFRAELPQEKLWISVKTVAEQKIYVLSMNEGLCIVHSPNVFPVNFQGIYTKE